MCKQNKQRFFDKFLPTGIVIVLLLGFALFLIGDIINPGKYFKNSAAPKLPTFTAYSLSHEDEAVETIFIIKEHIEL